MTWLKGEIVLFSGGKPAHEKLRKIRVAASQSWNEMYFFHVSLAQRAGYPDAALAGGKPITFEPEAGPGPPKVRRFRPYQGAGGGPPVPEGSFLHPYHFIPLAEPAADTLTDVDETLARGGLHDRFGPAPGDGRPRWSGRLVCQLTVEGATVVGGEQRQVDAEPTEVEPFELAGPGSGERRPAIPGSSLRGLVSSLVEAASGSSLRVLEDRTFSRRAAIRGESLSAVGMLVEQGGRLLLRPLTLSVEEMSRSQGRADPARCRVLLEGYVRGQHKPGSFLARRRPLSWSASHREFWYADLGAGHFYDKGRQTLGRFLDRPPIPAAEWKKLPEAERQRHQRGVLLIFGLGGSKAENLPPTKKFDYFLPYPPESEQEPLLEIEPAAVEDFLTLAKEAAEIPRGGNNDDLPYLPEGRARDPEGIEPRDGDLVHYELRSGRVCRLSCSALWRRRIPGSIHQAVSRVSEDLVPFHAGRQRLTLAERLFGFVEAGDGKRALAGRVRFSHGLARGPVPEGGWYEEPVPLKVLASPKPPSPALYFGQHGYLTKGDLDLATHAPQGRKAYLHQREPRPATDEPDEQKQLKLRVRPLLEGTRFCFHIDFENLDAQELGYLLVALRPTPAFRHKLGLGKPLGLGQVRIDPQAIFWIDRLACYQPEALFSGKYQGVESTATAEWWTELVGELAQRYRYEIEAASAPPEGSDGFPRMPELHEAVRDELPAAVRSAIELLGDPEAVRGEVTYPLLRGQHGEREHFRWFVANDKPKGGKQQSLSALGTEGRLPSLDRHRG